jgi:hypothetical protein
MRITPVHVLVVAIALAVAGCGKKAEPPPPPAPPPEPPPVTMPASPPPMQPAALPAEPARVAVAAVTVGNAIGADHRVSAATDTFAPQDTIYASVDTTGVGTASLAARWTYHRGDQVAVVKEDTMSITATGPATNEFHVSKPDGWPPGDYMVEITLNGEAAGSGKFVVK